MSDLTAKFAALETQLSAQAVITDGLVDTVEEKLQAIFDELDLMLVNNAANTKYLIAALGQGAACFPCPTPTTVVPPIATTPTTVDSDHCLRSQWIITTIQSLIAKMDVLQSYNVPATFSVLNDAISEVVGAIGAGDTIPLPTFPEVVQLVGTYFSYVGERAFTGVDLSSQFSTLYGPLVTAVNLSSDAGNARSQYEAIIDASDASTGAKFLFKAIAYNALWTYAFDPESMPDTGAFDGGACGVELPDITVCTNFGSTTSTFDGADFSYINLPPHPADPVWCIAGDYNGWTISIEPNVVDMVAIRLFKLVGSTLSLMVTLTPHSDPFTITSTTDAIGIIHGNGGDHFDEPFVARICPPS